MQFVTGWTYFHLNNGMRLDLMVEMKGLEQYSFEECYKLAYIATIHDAEVPFLHINHLLANKKAVNRDKDQLDIKALELIKKMENPDKENNP